MWHESHGARVGGAAEVAGVERRTRCQQRPDRQLGDGVKRSLGERALIHVAGAEAE